MTITAGEIAQARKLAAASRRRLVDVLEETQDGDADAFTARLAKTLRLEYLTMSQLREASPAFDLLPFGECAQRGCALLRAADGG
jgi:general secretion pathway protein E